MEAQAETQTSAGEVEGEVQASDQESVKRTEASEKRKREEEEENPLWKTSLCSYFRRAAGSCSHGDACRYAHSEAELRPRPDNSWDPTSERAKKLLKTNANEEKKPDEEEEEEGLPAPVDVNTLDKCVIGLPRKWTSESFRSFLDGKGIPYRTAKKKKGMSVGFVSFADAEQVKSAIQALNETTTGGKQIKVADAVRRSQDKKHLKEISADQTKELFVKSCLGAEDSNGSASHFTEDANAVDNNNSVIGGSVSKTKTARDVVTPLADMPYMEQLEHKKNSLLQTLKRLTRNARKACPDNVSLPEWILKSREIGGLPCELEGVIQSPVVDGYRNKCEFSVGYSLQGKRTVGFMLGNFRQGVTAVEEPVNCPNVSRISCGYALIFQEFLESSLLPVWNRIDNNGFWRQFTVREGRNPGQVVVADNVEDHIAEVMLIVQVCSLDVDEEIMRSEFKRMVQVLIEGSAACFPPLPLTTVIVQDHKGISNAAPADCPMIVLPLKEEEGHSFQWKENAIEARIHDYINNLQFCISPTAFFQVNTLAAERLYSLAGDWANLGEDTLLFDICCGTGTIGLTLANHVGMVVGIEMNESAVSDACRNAEINGITNCRFVHGKAEDVIGALLKEYLTSNVSESKGDIDGGEETNDPNGNSLASPEACTGDVIVISDASADKLACSEGKISEGMELLVPECQVDEKSKLGQSTMDNINDNCENGPSNNVTTSQENPIVKVQKATNCGTIQQFKNVVAIVDPPRVGLHPVVLKALRTHPCLRRLIYISCNPESLVANAIELCTPSADKLEKAKGNRRWRNMSSAGLARYRAKSMPNSEPFRPVRVVAVDLFPHTPHCEMVMLLER